MRQFVGVQIDAIPDETTILKFRHLLEKHDIPKKMFEQVNAYLASHGLIVKQCTLVDATIIHAPPSSKNSVSGYTRGGVLWLTPIKGEKTEQVNKQSNISSQEPNRACLPHGQMRVWLRYATKVLRKTRHNCIVHAGQYLPGTLAVTIGKMFPKSSKW